MTDEYDRRSRVLGKGAFASVKLATRKSDGTKWAVKIIHKGSLSQEDEAALQTEVEILQVVYITLKSEKKACLHSRSISPLSQLCMRIEATARCCATVLLFAKRP